MACLDRALAGGRCGAMDALRGIAHRPAVVRRGFPRCGGILGVGALLDVEAAVELSERLGRAAPDEGGNQSSSASSSASSSEEGGRSSEGGPYVLSSGVRSMLFISVSTTSANLVRAQSSSARKHLPVGSGAPW